VIKVQSIIRKHTKQGYAAIIIGDRDHPEVAGLRGYAGDLGYVAGSVADLEALPHFEKAIIVAQTTQNTNFFEIVRQWAAETHPEYKVFNTICDSTERRQAEVKRLAQEVDAVIVVGGRNSGNTQRLTEIAAESGKPAYHIETEKDLEDLDLKRLTAYNFIGITAGASTPNWIIKRVYRALEAMRFKKARTWRRFIFVLQRALLLTNIYVALGAGSLCYACTRLLGIDHVLPYAIVAMLYVQSMHTLNHLTGRQSDRYNDPGRANFYVRHKIFLTLLAVLAGAAGLLLAFAIGRIPFLILLVMSLTGLTYNLRIVPQGLPGLRHSRLRDIPGSKTFLITVAWGIVTSLFPAMSASGTLNVSALLVFFWSMGLVFVRTAFFDILDMQGDRIVGKETIPILLGEKRSMDLLRAILLVALVILLIAVFFGLIPWLGLYLVLCPVFMGIILLMYQRSIMVPGIRMEFLLETNFVLAGLIAFIWTHV
jgi:4-hydroxy-3-methylbut-2-enyl diphosphate reductase